MRGVLERLLIARGYHVLTAADAETAKRIVAERLGEIDLLLVGGDEPLARLGRPPSVLVLQKPFAPDDLERRVRAILSER